MDDGGSATDEHCPLVPVGAGPSTDKLRGAEEAVLAVRGRGEVVSGRLWFNIVRVQRTGCVAYCVRLWYCYLRAFNTRGLLSCETPSFCNE